MEPTRMAEESCTISHIQQEVNSQPPAKSLTTTFSMCCNAPSCQGRWVVGCPFVHAHLLNGENDCYLRMNRLGSRLNEPVRVKKQPVEPTDSYR